MSQAEFISGQTQLLPPSRLSNPMGSDEIETMSEDADMATENQSGLYFGAVTHRRFKPKSHFLRYRVFSALLDLDDIDGLDARCRFFSRGRFNLFSFHDQDYGDGKPADIAAYIRETLADHGVDGAGRLLLLCYPRMLGFAFTPLAVYYCHDRQNRLSAVLYEVRNTFGGRHSYLIPVEGAPSVIAQAVQKRFHVSPFLDMDMRYHFRLTRPDETIAVAVRETDPDGPILHAAFAGDRSPLTDQTLLKAFFAYPLMTVKVVLGIHWEALRLVLKGLRLRAGDPTPINPITLVTSSNRAITPAE